MLELLLDEHISPSLVARLAQLGVYAQSVPHIGLAGQSDRIIWAYACQRGSTVVTINARDFIELLDVELHPGLIVLRQSGLTRGEQWSQMEPVVRHILNSGDPDYMLNKIVVVTDVEEFEIMDLPPRV